MTRHAVLCMCTACRDRRREKVRRTRAEQGLPPTVSDPAAIALVVQFNREVEAQRREQAA